MSKDRSAKPLLIALAVLVSSALAWWLYSNLEMKELHLDLGWSPEASRHPYLATKFYLESNGAEVKLFQSIPSEEDFLRADTIFLINNDFLPLESQQQLLEQWIADGGNLIVGAGNEDSGGLLARLGFEFEYEILTLYREDSDKEEGEEEEEQSFSELLREQQNLLAEENNKKDESKEQGKMCVANWNQCNELVDPAVDKSKLVTLFFEGDSQEIYLHTKEGKTISHPKMFEHESYDLEKGVNRESFDKLDLFYWAGDDTGTRFVQANFGKGMITIINDPQIFSSAYLGHFDHAYLLNLLSAKRDVILILEGKQMSALSTLLWRYYRESLAGLLLLLLLGYWNLNKRFGAIRDAVNFSRRSREEGMRAIGQWHWRREEGEVLLQPLRKQVLDAAARRWPGFKRWAIGKQEQKIASFCQLDTQLVSDVLSQKKIKDEQHFLFLVKNLQKIRKAL